VYERLWGQGHRFDAAWRKEGLLELTPLMPQSQPAVLKLEQTWKARCEPYIKRGLPAQFSSDTGALPTTARTETTFDELTMLSPVSVAPRVYEVHRFLSSQECEHLIRIGLVMCLPSRGGSQDPLGSADLAALQSSDPLLADIRRRVGVLVGMKPHDGERGLQLIHQAPPEVPANEETSKTVRHDAFNGPPHLVTVRIFLSNAEGNERTVFPLADAGSRAIDAARTILGDKERKLAEAENDESDDAAAKNEAYSRAIEVINKEVIRCERNEGGVALTPRQGTAIVIYSMLPNGDVDPSAFYHSSPPSAESDGTWTLHVSKELPSDRLEQSARSALAKRLVPGAAF